MTTARTAALALVAVFAVPACRKPLECTCEVTEGAGTHRASVRAEAGEEEAVVRRRALAAACAKLCGARDSASAGCSARCQVDAGAGKIGARTRCAR